MPMRRKLGVLCLFNLGFIATAAAAVKVYYVWKMFYATYDESWYAYPMYISTAVEIDLGLVSFGI